MALFNSFRPLKSLSLYVIIGLGLSAGTDTLSGIAGLGQIFSPDSAFELGEDGPVSIWLLLQGVIYLLKFPTYVFTVVMFLVWLHRAHSNLATLGARNLDFTPGWAVGWWFIPFANLVKPFQAVREVWSESDPEADDSEQVFFSTGPRTAPTYMGVWWAMWLLSNFSANVASRVYDPDTMSNVEIGGVLFVTTAVLSVVAAILAIMLVRDITARQAARYTNLLERRSAGDAPPPPPTFDRDL
jgi:hypothetical protein